MARPLHPIISTLIATIVLLVVSAWAVFVFQPFGQRGWIFATIAALLAGVIFGIRPRPKVSAAPEGGHDRTGGSPLRVGRAVLIGALAGWLGLIAWSSWSPGGIPPSPKADSDTIRVLTWNILHGTERGMPWSRYGWPVRKDALRSALDAARPDILCVQEALFEQVESVAAMLPGHRRVGVGRDDGHSSGEHCAIYYDGDRFHELGGGTFWLDEPADSPPALALLGPKRICTWVRIRDTRNDRCFRVYNMHSYLTQAARVRAVRIVLDRIASGDPTDAILVSGDFNATPDDPDRRLFDEAGIVSSGKLAGAMNDAPTYHFYGIRLRSLDEILIDGGWCVVEHRVLDVKPGNTFPSDHFGVMADLVLRHEAGLSPDPGAVDHRTPSRGR